MRLQRQRESQAGKHFQKLTYWAGGLLWALSACWFLFPPAQSTVEYCFSRGWYRRVLDWTLPWTQWTRFPLILALVAAAVAVFTIQWIRKWIHLRHGLRRSRWAGFLWGVRCIFLALPVTLLWFILFWGAGYRRIPVEQRLDFNTAAISPQEESRLREFLLENVKRNATLPQERDARRAVRSIATAMTGVVEAWDRLPIRLPRQVKSAPRGLLLSSGTSGMCAPFTLEALVDSGLPDTAFVYAAAHELGHVAGFCPEDEASFAGYVSGLQAEDQFARYACALSAYVDMIHSLKSKDLDQAIEALPQLARQDLRAAEEAYGQYQIKWFSSASWRAYDKYLRAQGIREGIRSYSRGVELLGYAWRQGIVKQ